MDWFLHDKDTRHVKEFRRSSLITLRKSFLTCRRTELPFFFLSGFFFTNIMIHRAAGERVGYFFNSSLPLPHALQTLRHYPGYCCRELTSAHSSQLDSYQKHLVSYRKSLSTKLHAL